MCAEGQKLSLLRAFTLSNEQSGATKLAKEKVTAQIDRIRWNVFVP